MCRRINLKSISAAVMAGASLYLSAGVLLGAAASAQTNLVTDGGFEAPDASMAPQATALCFPTSFAQAGQWRGDRAAIVAGTNQGIAPFEGSQMLHLIFAAGSPSELNSSQLKQIIDLRAFETDIDAGGASLSASARFNRVQGDAQTDTLFSIQFAAYQAGDTPFPSPTGPDASGTVLTDGDVNTWQLASADLVLPVGTDFVLLQVFAAENIKNDTSGTEFDGHYADDVVLTLNLPGPVTVDIDTDEPMGQVLRQLQSGYQQSGRQSDPCR